MFDYIPRLAQATDEGVLMHPVSAQKILMQRVGQLACVIVLSVALAATAGAQTAPPSGPPAPLDDAARGKMFDQYATVAGGWYLEGRCNTLSPELKRELNWNVAQTNIALMADKTNVTLLLSIQNSAKNVAQKTSCENARSLIAQILVVSRNTTLALTGKRYSVQEEAQFDGGRIAKMLVGQAIDDKCHLMPADVRKSYDGRIQQITSNFAASYGSKVVEVVKADAARFDVGKFACNDNARTFLQTVWFDAQDMLKK